MDTASVIIIICVCIPAVIACSVCAILYYSHRRTNRKYYHEQNLHNHSSNDGSRRCSYRPPITSSPFVERYPSQPLPASFTPIRLATSRPTPSIHAAMPPSYEELFLTPQTLTNR